MRAFITLAVLSLAAPAPAGPTVKAKLVVDAGGSVHPACRPWLEGVVSGAGWRLLPAAADPVQADVVLSVKLQVHRRGQRRGAACEVVAFETPTSARVAAAAELGRPADDADSAVDQVCKSVADQLVGQVERYNAKVAAAGLAFSLTLRFPPGLSPAPDVTAQRLLQVAGFEINPRRSTLQSTRLVFRSPRPAAAVQEQVERLLRSRWSLRRQPPSSIPGNPRILLYLLGPKKD
jgi:hypothetical protein